MRCKLLYSGFETCFGPSIQGARIRYQNTSQIQILLARHFEKKNSRRATVEFEIDGPQPFTGQAWHLPEHAVHTLCLDTPKSPP